MAYVGNYDPAFRIKKLMIFKITGNEYISPCIYGIPEQKAP